jgi:hypothetical protein
MSMKIPPKNINDVEDEIKKLAEKSGFHTNVPIFNDNYSTQVAYDLCSKSVDSKLENRKKINDEDRKAVFRFLGYSSSVKPPLS